jgi:hypothetical protein
MMQCSKTTTDTAESKADTDWTTIWRSEMAGMAIDREMAEAWTSMAMAWQRMALGLAGLAPRPQTNERQHAAGRAGTDAKAGPTPAPAPSHDELRRELSAEFRRDLDAMGTRIATLERALAERAERAVPEPAPEPAPVLAVPDELDDVPVATRARKPEPVIAKKRKPDVERKPNDGGKRNGGPKRRMPPR